MTHFTFKYQEANCGGLFLNSDKGRGWFKVIFFDHSAIIQPTELRSKNNRRIRAKNIQTGDAVWPHEFIQATGESIEISNNKEQ
ncbi:MAG TPA: hypothetical protein VII28_13135 [Puia sp.]